MNEGKKVHMSMGRTDNAPQDRQAHQSPEPTTPGGLNSPDGKSQNEALASFFAGLMKRGGGSAAGSPKPGSS